MKIGDLVIINPAPESDPGRIRLGLIESRAGYKNCFVVRFFDGKSPSKNAYHRDKLRILSRRDDGR